jgi:hypothetical protein
MDPAPIPCPACSRLFRNKRGLGGHITTVSDPAHEAYRAAHGMPVKTPRATHAQARKEAKPLASANPAPSRPSPTVPLPTPSSPSSVQSIAVDPAPQGPSQRLPPKSDGLQSALQAAIEDYRRQTADAPAVPKSKPKKATKAEKDGEPPTVMSDAAGALAGAGIAAGVIGLVRLIASLKAPKAPPKPAPPEPAPLYGLPAPPPPPKQQDMPAWMSSLNGSLPFPGGLPPGQQREWWWL